MNQASTDEILVVVGQVPHQRKLLVKVNLFLKIKDSMLATRVSSIWRDPANSSDPNTLHLEDRSFELFEKILRYLELSDENGLLSDDSPLLNTLTKKSAEHLIAEADFYLLQTLRELVLKAAPLAFTFLDEGIPYLYLHDNQHRAVKFIGRSVEMWAPNSQANYNKSHTGTFSFTKDYFSWRGSISPNRWSIFCSPEKDLILKAQVPGFPAKFYNLSKGTETILHTFS
eukprot:TRINITY_DN8391_c0_g1_i1.p1 TRINITY_DN8391_c0_g1~~TRINITY_DN8391_c0_g1_i1.p1  ORF type:complete len:228 (-),score=14.97 TRINITY_DN8391_c0_g1_i1:114-797(-)